MSKSKREISGQINKPLLGRALRAIAMKQADDSRVLGTMTSVSRKVEEICATSACRKSGTIAL